MRHGMLPPSKAANARAQDPLRERTGGDGDLEFRAIAPVSEHSGTLSAGSRRHHASERKTAVAQQHGLSIRAENVLKELAVALTSEVPPGGRWVPSSGLLKMLRFNDLQTARNCGPQTVDEILRWARSQGVIIERPFHAGKPLSAMWRDISARSAKGECTRSEIVEALEKSLRRKNTRIPVALQSILVKVLNAASE
jgi:hypothetical protein